MEYHSYRVKIIHLSWVIGVLLLIIIAMLSSNIGARNDLKDILSFAVSFASLILALVAIGQALLSSSASNSTLLAVTEASNRLDQSSRDISSLTQSLPKTLDQVKGDIARPVSDLSSTVETLVMHTGEMKGQQSQIIQQQESLTKLISLSPSTASAQAEEFGYFTHGQALAVLICLKSQELSKPFDPNLVLRTYGGQYQSAVISTLRLANVIEVDEINGVFRINSMGKLIRPSEEFRARILEGATDITKLAISDIDTFFHPQENAADVPTTST